MCKKLISFTGLLLILLPELSAQLDTSILENGIVKITNLGVRKKVYGFPMPLGVVILDEFENYNSEGIKIAQRKYFNIPHGYYTILWNEKGQKYFEEYVDPENGYFLENAWDDSGKTLYNQLYTGKAYMHALIQYHDNLASAFKRVEIYELKPCTFENISFSDTITGYYWIESRDSTAYQGNVVEYYENGSIKLKGYYSSKKFDVYNTLDDYQNSLKNPDTKYANRIRRIDDKCKEGIWTYYTPDGQVEKIEIYDKCQLIKIEKQ